MSFASNFATKVSTKTAANATAKATAGVSAFLAVCASVLLVSAGAALATCSNDLPGKSVLTVYPDPTSTGSIGGIGPNQCGIEETKFCQNGRCLAFFDGLSGYMEITDFASGTATAPITEFLYDVTAAQGEVLFGGVPAPFTLTDKTRLRFVPAADHVSLYLPPPFDRTIIMHSTGSSGWEGSMPDWVGIPGTVVLYVDRLSAQSARLELFSDGPMFKLNAQLTLQRVGGPAPEPTPQSPATNTPADTSSADCKATDMLAQQVGASGDQSLIDAYYRAVTKSGITNWDARTPAQCAVLLEHLAAEGIDGTRFNTATSGNLAPTPDACAQLEQKLRPILRGALGPERDLALEAMVERGLLSLKNATPEQCAELAQSLGL